MLIEYFSRIGNIRSMIGEQKAQDSKFYSDPQSYIAYKFKNHQPTSLTDFFDAKTYGRVGYTIQVTPPNITDVESVLVIESIVLEGSVEQEVWNKRSSAKQQILQLLCKYIDNLSIINFSKYTKFVNMEIFDINDKRVLQLDSEGVIMKETKKEKAARLEEERLEQKKEMMKMQELERKNAERLEEERLNKKAEKEKEKEANKKRKEEEARKIKEEKKKNAEVEELLGKFEEEPSPNQSKSPKGRKN